MAQDVRVMTGLVGGHPPTPGPNRAELWRREAHASGACDAGWATAFSYITPWTPADELDCVESRVRPAGCRERSRVRYAFSQEESQ